MGTSIRHLNTREHINYRCEYGHRHEQHISNQNTPVHFFSQIVHNTKYTSSPKNMAWRFQPYFLWLWQKSASNLNLMTKWKTYLIWMQNCKRCFTQRVGFYIVYAGLQPPSSTHARLLPFWYLSNRARGKLPQYYRANDEQSGVSTKIPEFWNGRLITIPDCLLLWCLRVS